jgi:hypothetical protein
MLSPVYRFIVYATSHIPAASIAAGTMKLDT